MKAYTEAAIKELGEDFPIKGRTVEVIAYDGRGTCLVKVEGVAAEIPRHELYQKNDIGMLAMLPVSRLPQPDGQWGRAGNMPYSQLIRFLSTFDVP